MVRFFLYTGIFLISVALGIGVFIFRHTTSVPGKVENDPVVVSSHPPKTAFSMETAPRNSLAGTIATMSGSIKWQSRIATVSSEIRSIVPIQQGETIETQEDGNMTLMFADHATIAIFPKTAVDVIQTLPDSIVFSQKSGIIDYQAGTSPVSIRSLRLLTRIERGVLRIHIDDERPELTMRLKAGEATVAYNDADFRSQIVRLVPGTLYRFDSESRLFE